MMTMLGIAMIIAATASLVLACTVGTAYVICARRCDPKNRSFSPPPLPRIKRR
jgi:hypothetical protein